MGTKAMLEDVPAYSALDFHYKSSGQMRREPEIFKASAILEVSGRLNNIFIDELKNRSIDSPGLF